MPKYKIAFGLRESKYRDYAGNAYIVDASSERKARKEARAILDARFPLPYYRYRILYVIELSE